jgi:DNA-binding transcriptional LysR family regulator
MQEHIPAGQVRMRVDIFNSAASILRTGLGIGVLPAFAGAAHEELVAVSDPIEELDTPLWILTHPDLRRTARIQSSRPSCRRWAMRSRPSCAAETEPGEPRRIRLPPRASGRHAECPA